LSTAPRSFLNLSGILNAIGNPLLIFISFYFGP
jgi:hypothetical protein